MRNFLSRKTLLQAAIALLAIIFIFYRPVDRLEKNQVSISIGKQGSSGKDQPSIIIKGFAWGAAGDLAKDKEFFVPVSRGGFQWLQALVFIVMIGTCIVGVWLFIRLPYRVLYNIAKGKPFTEGNTKDLRRIGWGIVIIALVMLTTPLLARLLLASSVPEDIYYPFWNSLYDSRWWLLLGIVILLAARAFKEGYDIQKTSAKLI